MNLQKFRNMAALLGSTGSKTRSKLLTAVLCLAASIAASTPTHGQDQIQARTASRTELTVSTNQAGTNTEGHFAVKVLDATGQPVSDGSVSILSGSHSLGSALVSADGTATLNVSNLPAGSQAITASYNGGSNHAASQSTASAIVADASGVPTFTIAANPSSATVTAGQYANYVITVTPQNGFSDPITLTCGGNPPSTTCAFSPTTVIFPTTGTGSSATTGPVSSTLQVQTLGTSGKSLSENIAHPDRNGTVLAILLPGGLLLAGLGLLRRKEPGVLRFFGFVLLLAASCSGLMACSQRWGYLNRGPFPNTGTPAGNYSFSLTGYGNNGSAVTSQSINLTLTVQ